jgi:ATP-dependent DNA helicase RecQ
MNEVVSKDQRLLDLDHNLCLAVLAGLSQIPKNFGYGKTIAFFRGAKSRFIIKNDLTNNNYYGVFDILNRRSLEKILEYLHKENLICTFEVGRFNRPTLAISKLGQDALDGNYKIRLDSGVFSKNILELKDEEFFDRLSNMRYRLAQRDEIPAFCVCSNESIVQMSNNLPTSKEAMLQIKGIGHNFINKYGDAFLELINHYIKENNIEDF